VDATFLPQMENEVKEKKLAAWQRAVTAVLAWSK
jgi:glycerol kinase